MSEHIRHLVRVPISIEWWQDLITQDSETRCHCTKGLPPDAELVHDYYDPRLNCAYLVFQHPSFSALKPGEIIPDFIAEFHALDA